MLFSFDGVGSSSSSFRIWPSHLATDRPLLVMYGWEWVWVVWERTRQELHVAWWSEPQIWPPHGLVEIAMPRTVLAELQSHAIDRTRMRRWQGEQAYAPHRVWEQRWTPAQWSRR